MSHPASARWIVCKFGGTSVATRARWDTIVAIARERLAEGLRPVLVCSALDGVSDDLERCVEEAVRGKQQPILDAIAATHYALGDALGLNADTLLRADFEVLTGLLAAIAEAKEITPARHARVLATGELLATRLGAAFCNASSLPTAWVDARSCLVSTDEQHVGETRRMLSAVCAAEPDPALAAQFAALPESVLVTQGFIARLAGGDTVCLGRGGSDTSAAIFAARLGAVHCEIWTDVPGMFSADPRQVPAARLLRALDYDEAQEIATTGAKVLHPRCIAPLRQHRIPLHIRWIERPEWAGTVVSGDPGEAGPQIKAISAKGDITLIAMDTPGMWQQVGFLADTFAVFQRHGLSIDLVSTSEMNVTVSLDPGANLLDPGALHALLEDLRPLCTPRTIGPCAAVSLIGRNIRGLLHELGPALELFGEHRIHLVSQAASDLNFTVVVDAGQAEPLVRQLHALFFEDRADDALLGPSWRSLFAGGDAPAATDEVTGPTVWWRQRRDELLALARAAAPLYVNDAASLDAAAARLQRLAAVDRVFYALKANSHPTILERFAAAGLGFECVSPGEIARVLHTVPRIDRQRILFTPNFAPRHEYADAFAAGVMVTLDNAYPLERWPDIFRGRAVFLRLDPGRGRGHHAYVRTAGAQSKFGIAELQLDDLAARLRALDVRVIGLHAHIGSGIRDAGSWLETAEFLARNAARFPEVTALDLGGGLGVPEQPGQVPLDLAAFDASLQQFKAAHPQFELWLEPGRFLVAEAGVLLARVTQVKRKGDITFVGIETGMNSLIRPALYGAHHEIVNLTRLDEPPDLTANIVGPICESADVLGAGRHLPPTEEGDVLLIATAGAYGAAMSSHYNLREPAAEVMLPPATTAPRRTNSRKGRPAKQPRPAP